MANASAARQDRDSDVACGRQLGVDGRLDRVDEVARHPLELEIHATRPGSMLPPVTCAP